ncbi:cytochrome b/b6 domain-containing protein [Sphingomonas humi]|uniref:Cytochrome b/b6 domain-containing protein n=1 Tax=Sphingomonas humi TaxID=335630 RepID=A0ABP7S4G9_9SPHN
MTEEATTAVTTADAALAVPVWDLPIRIFHWSLVALIGFSWWSAENDRLEWHIWSGMTVLFLLLFRILWGFLGSSTARFSSFVTGPGRLMAYIGDPAGWRGIGHSPLGALSVIAILAVLLIQVSLGLPISDEDGIYSGPLNALVSFETAEWAHHWHHRFFTVVQALIALHVAAILYYRLRGKRLTRAMVTGRIVGDGAVAQTMVAAGPVRLLLCLAVAGGVTWWIWNGAPRL